MSAARCWCSALLLGGLAGCGGERDFSDLDSFMDDVRLYSPGPLETMPTSASYPVFSYGAASLRSPFSAQVAAGEEGLVRGEPRGEPDRQRPRQYLERFSIEQFEMVGTMVSASGTYALLRGAGAVHRLKVGDYLGRNEGRVVSVSESRVEVVELVPDGQGAWLERPRSLSLNTHS